jgi:glutamate 5-kinase
VHGRFTTGEVVQLVDEEENILGVAKVRMDANAIKNKIAQKNVLAAHADDIVIFNE